MKRKVIKPNAADIILADKEIMPIIRTLVEEASEKEYSKTQVFGIISKIWQEKPKQTEKAELTDDEQVFFEKTDSFFQDYGMVFVRRVCWEMSGCDWGMRSKIESLLCDTDLSYKILDSLKKFTKSAYCTFCREDKLTLNTLKKYNERLWGSKFVLCCNLFPVYCAIDDLLFIGDDKPLDALELSSQDTRVSLREHTISQNKDYHQFLSTFSFRATDLTRVALGLIWIISTYY